MHDHRHATDGNNNESCHSRTPEKRDWLLWVTLFIIIAAYATHFTVPLVLEGIPYASQFARSVTELVHKMWWGVALGIVFVGILAGVPRELIMSVLGKGGTLSGILRATAGGVLLDVCSHGILLVGMQLYKKGASLGQTMAFLIASPWNSLSLTLILWSLVGIKWTLLILALSLVIAIISGLIFESLTAKGILPKNPNESYDMQNTSFVSEAKSYLKGIDWNIASFTKTLKAGMGESRMILRWIFFGIVLAALIRATIPTDTFSQVFGPTAAGLAMTVIFATILEVCSEGSMPVAADIFLRAKAPGNMFAFLMTGVSTDYTEMLSLKETTGRWKTALFLPLVTLPQVIIIAAILNGIQ